MGWGTFIAGRLISGVRRSGRPSATSQLLDDVARIGKARKQDFENAVIEEVNRLHAEGKPVDINEIKVEMFKIRRAYERIGPVLDTRIKRIAQEKLIAGEEVDYVQIEREIIEAYKPFPWGKAFLWVFFPYIPLGVMIYKHRKENRNPGISQ